MRPLVSFNQGVFEVDDPKIMAIAFCKEEIAEYPLTEGAATLSQPPMIETVRGEKVLWTIKVFDGIAIWMASCVE